MSGEGTQLKITLPGTGPAPGQGTADMGTLVPAQDYHKLRRECLKKKILFQDPCFPADERSLFFSQKLPFKPEWKRPGDIVENPKLFTGGASRFDVAQGMLGDCWLVAAIASLTQDTILLDHVIPKEQGWEHGGYAGIFHFKFWYFGEWVDIVIDDRLPTYNGRLIFIHSTDHNEFWSALLEKAFAKLYGGYEALKGGKTAEAMTDFTGGVVETYDLTKNNPTLFDRIVRCSNRCSLMSCSIAVSGRDEVEAKMSSGLVKGHAYSVTKATTVSVKGKVVKLVRIRNPWGQKEWTGDWSDGSPTWNQLSASVRKEVQGEGPAEDGEFWMSFDDFTKNFTDFEVCSVTISEMEEDENVKSWNSIIINGEWSNSKGTAGGCRNYPTFVKNPQYVIDLKEDADGDGKCSVLVALMQKHRRKQRKMGVQDLCIGFSIYKAPSEDNAILTKQYVDYNYSTGTSGSFTNSREVMKRFDLDPGRYVIVPCAFKPGEEGDFLLRIFTESYSEEQSQDALPPVAGAGTGSDPKIEKVREMFKSLAGEDNEIDSEELQDILTASLSKDMDKDVFSIDACRSMIAMLDVDKNGTLDFDEFQNLLKTIGAWKQMFYKFDKDRSGTLEKYEVASAIHSLGYDISPEAMSILFNRFARKRKYMKLDDFAACLSRIKIMNDTFKKVGSGGVAKLSKDEFFKITLDA